jgi:dTDP-4-dehydrorhamnose 3,5-epimerase
LQLIETKLPGVLIIQPRVFTDERGWFMESFNQNAFRAAGLPETFVQDNHSSSFRGVVRGLHYQEPNPQGKLVRCTRGSVFDVAVDIRRGSPTFGQWFATVLSATNNHMLWIPEGYAHGFCTLDDVCDLVYKCTTLWDAKCDRSLLWNDPDIGIEWPITEADAILSPKDAAAPRLRDLPR